MLTFKKLILKRGEQDSFVWCSTYGWSMPSWIINTPTARKPVRQFLNGRHP